MLNYRVLLLCFTIGGQCASQAYKGDSGSPAGQGLGASGPGLAAGAIIGFFKMVGYKWSDSSHRLANLIISQCSESVIDRERGIPGANQLSAGPSDPVYTPGLHLLSPEWYKMERRGSTVHHTQMLPFLCTQSYMCLLSRD